MSRLSSQLRFNDLTGGINNVYDKEMINSSTRKTETPDMVNVEYFQLGGIKTMGGNTLVGGNKSIQKASIVGGWEYTKNSKKYMIIGLSNGEVRRYNEGIYNDNKFELIYKFSSISDRMSFCNMNNGVVITNGIDDLLFYEYKRTSLLHGVISTEEGSSIISGSGTKFTSEVKVGDGIGINNSTYYISEISDASTLVVDRPIMSLDVVYDYKFKLADTSLCNATLINTDTDVDTTGSVNVPIRGLAIQYYKGRLYIGTKQGLFYSPIGEYNNWNMKDDAGVFYDIYNDNSEVTALGLYSDYMLVHKKFNTYILSDNGSGKADESLSINPFSNITCDSQQSWIVSNTKYYIYSKEFMDIYPLVQRTIYNDRFLGEPITQKVRELFKDIRAYDTKNIFCVSRPKQRQMIFYLPTTKVKGSGEALIFDFQTKSWLLRRLPNWTEVDAEGNTIKCITNVTCAFNFNNDVYIGTSDGMVLKEFNGDGFTVSKLNPNGTRSTMILKGNENASIRIDKEKIKNIHNSECFCLIDTWTGLAGNVTRNYVVYGNNNNWLPYTPPNHDLQPYNDINTVSFDTWYGMAWDGEKFLILSRLGYVSNSYIKTDKTVIDFVTPTKIDNLSDRAWYGVTFDGIKFTAIDLHGYVSTSLNFYEWDDPILKYELAGHLWQDICSNNYKTVAIARDGSIAYTDDNTDWNIIATLPQLSEIDNYWHSIEYGNGQYVALSRRGYIAKSSDLETWSEPLRVVPSYVTTVRIRYDGNSFVIIGEDGYFYKSSDLYTWEPMHANDGDTMTFRFCYSPMAVCFTKQYNKCTINITSNEYGDIKSSDMILLDRDISNNNDVIDYFYLHYNTNTFDDYFNFYEDDDILDKPVYDIDYSKQIIRIDLTYFISDKTGLHAYYKSPWFDWAGNYYQSFAEFFVEVNSDYKNRFIIRTQKDGTSRYEDRLIDENKFVDKTNTLVWDDESKHWGGINEDTNKEYKHDDWAKITFDTLRVLLPNSVFESFQFELKADKVGDGFHIYQYGFRRIETEEAPW